MSINKITKQDVNKFKAIMQDDISPDLLNFYQEIATKSAIYPGQGTPFGLMYTALGLAEAGEVQNKTKKAFRDDGVIEFLHKQDFGVYIDDIQVVRIKAITDERKQQLVKELGGVLWYVAATCNELGITMSQVALANLEELCGRTERGTLSGSGDER